VARCLQRPSFMADDARVVPDPPRRSPFRWSWRIGTIAGIGLFLHWTFPLLLIWVIAASLLAGAGPTTIALSIALILAIFGAVVLHELGHALTGRRLGVEAHAITLLPIGGVSSFERMPERPRDELLVALAGPAVSVALALVLAGLVWLAGGPLHPAVLVEAGGGALAFVARLAWINLILAVFNLIPAFPLDGGRVLRALLAVRLGAPRATQVAAMLGRGFAIVLAVVGLLGNPLLIVIALFVWLAARGETALVQTRADLTGLPVTRAMITDFHSLSSRDPLRAAVDLILAGFQDAFPIVDGGRLVGVLTRDDVLRGLADGGPQAPIAAALRTRVVTVEPTLPLERALDRLTGGDTPILVVVDGERILGLVTPENLEELLQVRRVLAARSRVRPGARLGTAPG
jgi:Zn-dependent protease/CBS domain-containing protein